MTRTPLSGSKGQGHQGGLLIAAFMHQQLQRSAWERIDHGKLLLCCRLQVWQSARRREVLRRPHGEERGRGISCHHAHSLFDTSHLCQGIVFAFAGLSVSRITQKVADKF